MKNLFLKKNITIEGGGGMFKGGGGAQQSPPPNISQYPGVLTPPIFNNLNSINSFSYAEVIDLISDGPIEGLVNKNNKKVYDENIFEGIFLNDTPIKETSSEKRISIPIQFIKNNLKKHFANSYFLDASMPRVSSIPTASIDDVNFNSEISITSYHPTTSVYEFVVAMGASFDSISLIQKNFDLSPIINERPFLTKITIPQFIANLPKDKFDITEGGTSSPMPLKMGITDLSSYIYFSIGSETLNSFNYFELPRTFVHNNSYTVAGKKSFKKTLLSDANYYKYSIYDVNIYIWSIYNDDIGIKNIDSVLDKYLNNIYIYQNSSSLFNYNLIQSEFKNGSEIQAPLKYFTNVQIDTEYSKELVGPFCVTNNYAPAEAFGCGGIQRVTSYNATNSYTMPDLNQVNVENETSDDIRYVKSWAVQYDKNGGPFMLCDVKFNYSIFDKTTASRTAQQAVPITHYIANDNVEQVYITLNINALSDTNHIDLASPSNFLGSDSKSAQTNASPIGTNTLGNVIGYDPSLGSQCLYTYFLLFNPTNTTNCSYVLDGYRSTGTLAQATVESCLSANISRLTESTTNDLYYRTLSTDNNGLATKINNLKACFGLCTYILNGNLINYQIPNDKYQIRESFLINNYLNSPCYSLLETKLKTLSDDGDNFYCFGLNCREILLDITKNTAFTFKCSALTTSYFTNLNANSIKNGGTFSLGSVGYRTVSFDQLISRYSVVHVVNHYINWNSLINSTNNSISLIDKYSYPNIYKYIISPYVSLNQQAGTSTNAYNKTLIGRLYLVGINGAYLRSQSNFFNGIFLKNDILEQLLDEFLLKTDQSSNFSNLNSTSDSYDTSSTSAIQQVLSKFENGKLIGTSTVYRAKMLKLSDAVFINNSSKAGFVSNPYILQDYKLSVLTDLSPTYNINNVFLYRNQYLNINDNDKKTSDGFVDALTCGNDKLLQYSLVSNTVSNTSQAINNTAKSCYNSFDGTAKSTQPALACFNNTQQSIAAGTKMPAIVVVDVETGYETQENETFRGNCEYFSYRYNIFGMANEGSLIDLGRNSYPFVVSCKQSIDRGGYLGFTRSVYYTCQPLNLAVLICCSGTSAKTGYYLLNNKPFYLGDINLDCYQTCSLLNISFITGSDASTIGLKQKYSGTFGSNYTNPYNISNNFNCLSGAFSQVGKTLTAADISNNFNNGYCTMDLSKIYPLAKNKNLVASNLLPVDFYICSFSINSSNCNPYDTYKLYIDENTNYLQLNYYNFNYTAYEAIEINPKWKNGIGSDGTKYIDFDPILGAGIPAKTSVLNFIVYKNYEGSSSPKTQTVDLYDVLNNKFNLTPNLAANKDLIIKFSTFYIRFIRSGNTPASITNPIIGTDLVSAYALKEISNVAPYADVYNSTSTSTLTSLEVDEIVNNYYTINYLLYSSDGLMFFGDNFEMLTPDILREKFSAVKLVNSYVKSVATSASINNNLGFYLNLNAPSNSYNKTVIKIDVSAVEKISSIDKRFYLGGLTLLDPVNANINFWTIEDTTNKRLGIIHTKSSRATSYAELNYDICCFCLNSYLDGEIVINVSHNNTYTRTGSTALNLSCGAYSSVFKTNPTIVTSQCNTTSTTVGGGTKKQPIYKGLTWCCDSILDPYSTTSVNEFLLIPSQYVYDNIDSWYYSDLIVFNNSYWYNYLPKGDSIFGTCFDHLYLVDQNNKCIDLFKGAGCSNLTLPRSKTYPYAYCTHNANENRVGGAASSIVNLINTNTATTCYKASQVNNQVLINGVGTKIDCKINDLKLSSCMVPQYTYIFSLFKKVTTVGNISCIITDYERGAALNRIGLIPNGTIDVPIGTSYTLSSTNPVYNVNVPQAAYPNFFPFCGNSPSEPELASYGRSDLKNTLSDISATPLTTNIDIYLAARKAGFGDGKAWCASVMDNPQHWITPGCNVLSAGTYIPDDIWSMCNFYRKDTCRVQYKPKFTVDCSDGVKSPTSKIWRHLSWQGVHISGLYNACPPMHVYCTIYQNNTSTNGFVTAYDNILCVTGQTWDYKYLNTNTSRFVFASNFNYDLINNQLDISYDDISLDALNNAKFSRKTDSIALGDKIVTCFDHVANPNINKDLSTPIYLSGGIKVYNKGYVDCVSNKLITDGICYGYALYKYSGQQTLADVGDFTYYYFVDSTGNQIFIYITINLLKNLIMACGCKNKNNEQTQVQTQQQQTQTQQQQNNESVKVAVTKIVEKYYNKK
jgi:hypothetical protein